MKKFTLIVILIVSAFISRGQEKTASVELKLLGKERQGGVVFNRYEINILFVYSLQNKTKTAIDSLEGVITFAYGDNVAVESSIVAYKRRIEPGEIVYSVSRTLPLYEDDRDYPYTLTEYVKENIKKSKILLDADLNDLKWIFVPTNVYFSKK